VKRHYVFAVPKDVAVFTRDLERALDNTRVDFVNNATFSARRYASWLTPRRLPSRGGGSYGRSHDMRIHHDAVGSMGLSVGEAYNNHQWAQAVEYGTEPHEIRAKTGAGMKITTVLPTRGGGRGQPPTPPYGTKYNRLKPPKVAYKVSHPGGRSFLVYTDTFKNLVGKVRKMLKDAFKRNW